jgi:hypothetical protein
VFICTGCALWAARRSAGGDIRLLAGILRQRVRARRARSRTGPMARSAIPVVDPFGNHLRFGNPLDAG